MQFVRRSKSMSLREKLRQTLQELDGAPTPQARAEADVLAGSVEYCQAKWRSLDGCPPEEFWKLEGLLLQIRAKLVDDGT